MHVPPARWNSTNCRACAMPSEARCVTTKRRWICGIRFGMHCGEPSISDNRGHRTNWRVWGAVAATLVFCALAATPFLVNARNQRQLVAEELLSAHARALIGRSVDV